MNLNSKHLPATTTQRWKPSVTVAGIIEDNGRFLLLEEHTADGLRLNSPAGHLDPFESPVEGCIREVLEETARHFSPTALLGIYLSRFLRPAQPGTADTPSRAMQDITYLRFAFCGKVGDEIKGLTYDEGIVRTLWMTPQEIRASQDRHRSPLVLQCVEDYLAGKRFPLEVVYTDSMIKHGL
jgi:8-oxo-dGTP pyrophosphatase MutT (NUDIX family)